jgi:hypothetical protein
LLESFFAWHCLTSLCRVYEVAFCSVSNLYPIESTFVAGETNIEDAHERAVCRQTIQRLCSGRMAQDWTEPMTRHAAHLNPGVPLLRAICLVVKSHRSNNDQPRQRACRTVANFPRRPDAGVLSKSIPLFFIGRNRNGLWVAREAEGRTGGIFLLKQSALLFTQKHSAPVGCATMFLTESIELDTENSGNPLVKCIDAALSKLNQIVPAYSPAVPIYQKSRKGNRQ